MRLPVAAICSVLVVFGCDKASDKNRSTGTPVISKPDAAEVLKGNIAINPIIRDAITQRDITDPQSLFAATEKALETAPSALEDATSNQSRSASVDQQLKAIMPINGKHLIRLQCGSHANLQQTFFSWNRIKGTISVTLPQFRSSQIKLISDLDSALTQQAIKYYSVTLALPNIENSASQVINTEKALIDPQVEKVSNEIKTLGSEGVEYKITPDHSLVVHNSGIDNLNLDSEIALQRARNAYLEDLLTVEQGGLPTRKWLAILESESHQWESFPPGNAKVRWSNWYREVPYHGSLEDVCLIGEFRDLYPPMSRPGELASIFLGSVAHSDRDLFGEVTAWYLVDKHSGKVFFKQEVGEPTSDAK